MSEKPWKWTGRFADVWALVPQPVADFAKRLWDGILMSALTAAVGSIQYVRDLGWGAVFIVGVVLGSAVLALYRYFRPLPAPASLAPAPPSALAPVPSATATNDLERAIAALRKDVDRALDAIHHNAQAAREEGEALRDAIRKSVASALGQVRKEQEASDARLKAAAEAAERRTKAVLDVLSDTYGPKFDSLDGKIGEYAERLGERFKELEAGAAAIEDHFHRLLRLRDADTRLRRQFEEVDRLASRVLGATPADHDAKLALSRDYDAWLAALEAFWSEAAAWDTAPTIAFSDLTRVSDADYADSDSETPREIAGDFALERRWQNVAIVQIRHLRHAHDVLEWIEHEARGG